MTSQVSVYSLITETTATAILEMGLAVARLVGLDVDSWRAGDPTRTLFKFCAEVLAARETMTTSFIKAGFLSTAEGAWLTVLASEVYGVDREEATYATPTVTLTNNGGGYYPLEAGDLRVKASSTGKTYYSTSAGTLTAGATITFDLVADEAGADSAVIVDEIDELVTPLLEVSVDSSTAATASDAESDSELRTRCIATTGALSPNGAGEAYEAVALNGDLTGVTEVNRAIASEGAIDGTVDVWIATASGAPSGASVTAVQTAIDEWATPIAIIATVHAATAYLVNVTAEVSGIDIPADIEDQTEFALTAMLAEVPIGGVVATDAIVSVIRGLCEDADATRITVTLTTPADHIELSAGYVPAIGTVSVVEV